MFPAITRQLSFADEDVEKLANLCHQCSACYAHCQYAPPHDFDVNVPKALAFVREDSYAQQLRPAWLREAFLAGNRFTVLSLTVGIFIFLVAIAANAGIGGLIGPEKDFYQLMPHSMMAGSFSIAALFVLIVWSLTARQLWWRFASTSIRDLPKEVLLQAFFSAMIAAITLKNLHGGHGEGCYEAGERPSPWRRHFHHLTFLGFILCFLATVSGTIYHYFLNTPAPYGFSTLPKLFGVPGGLLLVIGTVGLLISRAKTHKAITTEDNGSGVSLTILLLLTALSGLVLPVVDAGKGLLLGIHLGIVLALFLNFACGKFLHALFRLIALTVDEADKATADSI